MILCHQHNSTPNPGGNRPFSLEVATWDIRHPPLRKGFICIATLTLGLFSYSSHQRCQNVTARKTIDIEMMSIIFIVQLSLPKTGRVEALSDSCMIFRYLQHPQYTESSMHESSVHYPPLSLMCMKNTRLEAVRLYTPTWHVFPHSHQSLEPAW